LILGQIQPLIDNGIIDDVLKLVAADETVRWKLVKIVKYVTRGTPSQVRFLVDRGTIHILCRTLSDFRSYDRVLTEVYKVRDGGFSFFSPSGHLILLPFDFVVWGWSSWHLFLQNFERGAKNVLPQVGRPHFCFFPCEPAPFFFPFKEDSFADFCIFFSLLDQLIILNF
jgi:hypothetical protein